MKKIAENNFYCIEVNEEKNRLYIKISNFWEEVSDIPEYLNDLEKAIKVTKAGFTILADLRKMKPPTSQIVELHTAAQKLTMNAGLSKTAEIYPESAIAKLSIKKFSDRSGMEKRVFSEVKSAEEWLDL